MLRNVLSVAADLYSKMIVTKNSAFTTTRTLFLALQIFRTSVLINASGIKCPLSCRCHPDRKKPDFLAVSCTDFQIWNTLPLLPNNTVYLNIIGNKMSVAQRSLFKNIGGESLMTFKLIKNKITYIQTSALNCIHSWKF